MSSDLFVASAVVCPWRWNSQCVSITEPWFPGSAAWRTTGYARSRDRIGLFLAPPSPSAVVENITDDWKKWSSKHTLKGPYAAATLRSLITLKALIHHETGGIVAAAT